MDIIAAYREVGTYRGAAATCGTTPKTVKRVIDRQEAGDARPARKSRPATTSRSGSWWRAGWPRATGRSRPSACCRLRARPGCVGPDRNLRRLVADARAAWRRDHHRGRRPAVWSPGEHLVIDCGMQAGLHVCCAVLAWSRWRFVRFAAPRAVHHDAGNAGGVLRAARRCPEGGARRPDGLFEGWVVANTVVPTPDYVRFASHYRFRPDWCEAADPESKGIVENLVGYAKSDLLVPLLTEAAAVEPVSASTANAAAQSWCVEVNAAVHSEICAIPSQRLTHEATFARVVAVAEPADRPGAGAAQGRPPVVRQVRLGPVLGADEADREQRAGRLRRRSAEGDRPVYW
jgi:hypothetical protein